MKVLYTRGDDIYVAQKGDNFYLVNLRSDRPPLVSPYPDSFLKFGYFEPVDTLSEDVLKSIEERITKE